MKKRFSKLSKAEQEKIEMEYHQMKPEEFDEPMSRAKQRSPEEDDVEEYQDGKSQQKRE